MLNFSNRNILILFSIIFILGLIFGGIIQSVFYFFIFNGVFTLLSIWMVYWMCHKPHVEINQTPSHQHEVKNKEHLEEPVVFEEIKNEEQVVEHVENKPKKLVPDENDTVYEGCEISMDELNRMKKESQSWYGDAFNRIGTSILEIKKMSGEIDNGEK